MIHYQIAGGLTYKKASSAKKARKALAAVALSAPGLDALLWDGDRGFSVEFSGPIQAGLKG